MDFTWILYVSMEKMCIYMAEHNIQFNHFKFFDICDRKWNKIFNFVKK